MQATKNIYWYSLPSTLLLTMLLSIFPRPATAASTRQGTPPPIVTVVRIADLDSNHVTK
ncbi:MAG: hypothetical protein P8130_02055 [Deltaproteobacteria bacterium]